MICQEFLVEVNRISVERHARCDRLDHSDVNRHLTKTLLYKSFQESRASVVLPGCARLPRGEPGFFRFWAKIKQSKRLNLSDDLFGSPHGEPFGLLIGEYEFDQSPEDVRLLTEISYLAAGIHSPFVAASSPSTCELETFPETSVPTNFLESFERSTSSSWRSFRESEESRFIGLVLPRLLGRLPYGSKTNPIEGFEFEEWDGISPDHDDIWMNGAWAFAACVADSMAIQGWPAAIQGSRNGLVRGLLCYPSPIDLKGSKKVGPLEINISYQRAYELTKAGFIPVLAGNNDNSAIFLSTPSCQLPKNHVQSEARTTAEIASQINMTLCVSRFAHYLKILCLDENVRTWSVGDRGIWLNEWIRQYVRTDEDPLSCTAARPLADARVVFTEYPGQPNSSRLSLLIKPRYQLDEMPLPLQLVFEVPGRFA